MLEFSKLTSNIELKLLFGRPERLPGKRDKKQHNLSVQEYRENY
jgi:hypothetical protein